MRTKLFILSLSVFVMSATILLAINSEAASSKRYDLKSGYAVVETKAGPSVTREEVYFDDHGAKEARYSESEVNIPFLGKQVQKTLTLIDWPWMYNIDLAKNTGTKINYQEMIDDMSKNSGANNPYAFGMESMKKMADKLGTEKYLGHKVDVYQMKDFDSKAWVHKGFPLKSVSSFAGFTATSEAVEFKPNAKVDKSKFALPADIQLEDAPNPADIMAQIDAEKKRAMKESGLTEEEMNAYQNAKSPDDINAAMEAYKNKSGGQNQEFDQAEYERSMQEAQKAMKEAGPEFGEAMDALQSIFN